MRPFVGRYGFPSSLAGMTVLDVGASNGFFSFHFEKLGARRVIATDLREFLDHDYPEWLKDHARAVVVEREREGVDQHQLKGGFEIAKRALGSRVEKIEARIYDLPARIKEPVDFAFCGSVLVHLRDPVGAVESIRRVVKPGGQVIIATPVDLTRPEASYAVFMGEPRQCAWWVFSPAGLVKACEAAGLSSVRYHGDFRLSSKHPQPIVDNIGVIHASATTRTP